MTEPSARAAPRADDIICFYGLSPEAAAEQGITPHVVCPAPSAHQRTEPFDEAQAWADEAARNGDPELA